MRADRFTALIDANVLAGALPRNMLLSLAEAGFFRPRWSQEILAETERAICRILKRAAVEAPDSTAAKQRLAIERAFPEANVTGYEPLIQAFDLPDANDRHVLAAAVQIGAAVIVTENKKDFPDSQLNRHNVVVLGTDTFLADVIDLHTPGAVAALQKMRLRFNRPELSAAALIQKMESIGLTQTANILLGEIASL